MLFSGIETTLRTSFAYLNFKQKQIENDAQPHVRFVLPPPLPLLHCRLAEVRLLL
jgi:hypothetical protein